MSTPLSTQTTDSSGRVRRADLDIAAPFASFVENEALEDTGIRADTFWQGLSALIRDLTPRNRELLHRRDEL